METGKGGTGILLLQMGGPATLAEIRPFLTRLFADPAIIPIPGPAWLKTPLVNLLASRRTRMVTARYQYLGGGSPLNAITAAQARELEKWLAERGRKVVVRAALRYAPPGATAALQELLLRGVTRVLAVSLYPHYCGATTGSSLRDFREAAQGTGLEIVTLDRWGDHPPYLDLLGRWVADDLGELRAAAGDRVAVVFSAHGVPQSLIRKGDPYQRETEESARGVAARLGPGVRWHLSWQSAVGPVKWLEPSTDHVLEQLAVEGVAGVLLVPLSFVSDHIETLYDLDRVYRSRALELGIPHYRRLRSFNQDPEFIRILGGLALDRLGGV